MPPDHADPSLLLTLPDREGPRPTTSLGMPHSQLIVLARGWGEPHPIDGLRPGLRYLMVFAPRDLTELATVQTIVRRAYEWTLSDHDSPQEVVS